MIIKGIKLRELDIKIYATTSGMFADMLNPEMRGPNFRFTPKKLATLSFSVGIVPSGYKETDIVREYPENEFDSSLKVYWIKLSEHISKRLIDGSGINEFGKWE